MTQLSYYQLHKLFYKKFAKRYDELRQKYPQDLYSDGKAQITGIYDNDFNLISIKNFTISYQNSEKNRSITDILLMRGAIIICKEYGVDVERFLINPTGKFIKESFILSVEWKMHCSKASIFVRCPFQAQTVTEVSVTPQLLQISKTLNRCGCVSMYNTRTIVVDLSDGVTSSRLSTRDGNLRRWAYCFFVTYLQLALTFVGERWSMRRQFCCSSEYVDKRYNNDTK